jgi:hypothetical protein
MWALKNKLTFNFQNLNLVEKFPFFGGGGLFVGDPTGDPKLSRVFPPHQ